MLTHELFIRFPINEERPFARCHLLKFLLLCCPVIWHTLLCGARGIRHIKMKVSLALIIAVIGFVMVVAEETLEDRLKMALKRLLEGDEKLHLEGRDTQRACLRATQNCNGHGECVEDSRGEWYCQCQLPYRVGGSESSCYLPVDKKEDLEMETKDSVSRCLRDTNNCDGHGKCEKSSFGRSYICFCDTGYISNSYGGCSVASTSNIAREVELTMLGWGTLNRCFQDTNNCDGAGVCVQSTFGSTTGLYICRCDDGYRNNVYGGCSLASTSNIAREAELAMLGRDTLSRCVQDTNNCDGAGVCVQSTFGPTTGLYICICIDGYRNNVYGGCSPRTEREIEYLSMIARDQEMQMQARDSLARCNQDTNKCDGFGECKKSVFGRTYGQYICSCDEGYRNNIYGGCSPEASGAQEQEGDQDNRELKIDVLRRLADLLAE